jgi:hypothetical protein
MRAVGFLLLIAVPAGTALAHPHPGGIVVRPDGTVVAGDILGLRLLVIEPGGNWREIPGVGHIRGLAGAADGTVYGVSWGQGGGVWKLGPDDRPMPVLADFNGLVALGEQGSLLLAPVDPHGRGQHLEICSPSGQRSVLATLAEITALARHNGTILVAAGSTIHTIDADGSIQTLAEDVGTGLYGLALGPNGIIAAVHDQRQVVEVAPDGARRVLLVSEPPWAPTDVAVHDGVLYVVELAQHPCCWKGPRVRRVVAGQAPATLLTIDDGNHLHISPGERPFAWMVGVGTLAMVVFVLGVRMVRQRRRRTGIDPTGPA